jgi:pSer/pThr/pTyr-binding forkhead associated (FHA) protein
MIERIADCVSRFRKDPSGFEREVGEPILWVTALPPDPAEPDTAQRLYTYSGAAPLPEDGEPFVIRVRKWKENAFLRGITVGRTPNNDLVIDHRSISRFHAWLERTEEGRWQVADAGSKNGTVLEGARLSARKPSPLLGGERLRFGAVSATFLLPPDFLRRLRLRAG